MLMWGRQCPPKKTMRWLESRMGQLPFQVCLGSSCLAGVD